MHFPVLAISCVTSNEVQNAFLLLQPAVLFFDHFLTFDKLPSLSLKIPMHFVLCYVLFVSRCLRNFDGFMVLLDNMS